MSYKLTRKTDLCSKGYNFWALLWCSLKRHATQCGHIAQTPEARGVHPLDRHEACWNWGTLLTKQSMVVGWSVMSSRRPLRVLEAWQGGWTRICILDTPLPLPPRYIGGPKSSFFFHVFFFLSYTLASMYVYLTSTTAWRSTFCFFFSIHSLIY